MIKNIQPHDISLFWQPPLADILRDQGVNANSGLGDAEIAARLEHYGANLATETGSQSLWLQFLLRFRNPLVLLLLAASVLSAITGDTASFVIIVFMVMLSVTFDFVQEVRAEKCVDLLRRSVAVQALVQRGGAVKTIPVGQLVPGDIVQLSAGTLVPADGRLVTGKNIYVNQALLTGESFPVEKYSQDLATPTDDITLATNALFMGTSVISGNGTMIIVNTGKRARLGQLAGTLAQRHVPTAFEQGVQRFGMLILYLAIAMVLIVLLINIGFHHPLLESFLFALALAVGLTPELLPMIMTITLARGATRMASQHVIVKHLPAMHNLGAMDILCTDKTGTLTEAKISLTQSLDAHWRESEHVFQLAYLNSYFESGVKTPLDQAILNRSTFSTSGWEKLDEVPFDFERRRISVLLATPTKHILIVKGAPEDILKLTTHFEDENGALQPYDATKNIECLAKLESLGESGFRVLAVALSELPTAHLTATISDETALTFAGFVVFNDPIKEDATATLRALAQDGIQVKVISGDNERVTRYVCDALGFAVGRILTGSELASTSDEALLAIVDDVHVFSRVTPQQKSRVITALKMRKHTVGFLGDGINDAAALHVADVGISVDGGTDVAKEAADVILLEHSLNAIHIGVIEGRRAVANAEKYILMGSSSNFGNMFSMAGASLFLPFLPMLPIQILLNNLLYDVSQTSLPFDNVDSDVLARPIHWDITRIKHYMWILGPVSSLFDFSTFYVLLRLFNAGEGLFQTGWFVESMVTQTLIIFAIRTHHGMFTSRPQQVVIWTALGIALVAILLPFTPIGGWFGLTPLPAKFFAFLGITVGVYFSAVELVKLVFKRYL